MSARRWPPTPEHQKWLKANGHDLGPLTGQDHRALAAIDACWQLLASCDAEGHRAALAAGRALLPAMQSKCWPLAKELIARALDWGDRDRLWPLVALGQLDDGNHPDAAEVVRGDDF